MREKPYFDKPKIRLRSRYWEQGDFESAWYLLGFEDGLSGYKSENSSVLHGSYQKGYEDGTAAASES